MASFTSFLYSILKVLYSTLGIKQEDVLESITEMKKTSKKINSFNIIDSNPSLDLAKWITVIPIIYYLFGLQSAVIRFKNSLQENAKIHAFAEDVIESCHNGIVSLERSTNVQPILIEDQDDHSKTKQRWQILEKFFRENDIKYKKYFS